MEEENRDALFGDANCAFSSATVRNLETLEHLCTAFAMPARSTEIQHTHQATRKISKGETAPMSAFFFLLNKKKLSKRAISLRIFGSVKPVKLMNEAGKQGFAKAAK